MINNLSFKYKGDRNYIHGTDIFNQAMSLIRGEFNDDAIDVDMSIYRIAKNCMYMHDFADEFNNQKPCVIFNIKSDTASRKTFFLYENEQQVTERYEYPEEQIIKKANYNTDDKTAFINNPGNYTFIENVVALNKGLLQFLLTDKPPGKWYFTKIKLYGLNQVLAKNYSIKIQFKKNMQFKLTDSVIYLNDNIVGNIYFSLV